MGQTSSVLAHDNSDTLLRDIVRADSVVLLRCAIVRRRWSQAQLRDALLAAAALNRDALLLQHTLKQTHSLEHIDRIPCVVMDIVDDLDDENCVDFDVPKTPPTQPSSSKTTPSISTASTPLLSRSTSTSTPTPTTKTTFSENLSTTSRATTMKPTTKQLLESAVWHAAAHNSVDVLRALLSVRDASGHRVVDVNSVDAAHWGTPLAAAAHADAVQAVTMLVAHGANVDAIDALWGLTPLMRAAEAGSLRAVCALVRAGADVERRANNGLTAVELTSMLRRGGAQPNRRSTGASSRYWSWRCSTGSASTS